MDTISIITSVIGLISLIALIYQSINLRQTISNQIYESFINNSRELDRVLIEYPHVRKYVYGDVPVDESTEELERVMSVVELIIDITENIEVWKKYIPKSRFDGWMQFVKDTQNTPAHKYYMKKHGKWFEVKE